MPPTDYPMRVKGPPGEVVHVSAVAPDELRTRAVNCTTQQGGISPEAPTETRGASCVDPGPT